MFYLYRVLCSTGKLEVVFFSTPESDIPSSSESTGIPLQHKFLTGNLPFQTLAAVSEDKIAIEHPENDIGSLALEGRVLQKAECQPPPNKKYMDMKVNHIEKISKPEKQIISINRAEVKFKPIARHAEDVTYGKRKGVKNVRLEKQSLLEILFQAFENHQYYKLVDLARVTQQPPNYLKEVLTEIAHYNTLPPHKFTWELKSEYRHYKKEEAAH